MSKIKKLKATIYHKGKRQVVFMLGIGEDCPKVLKVGVFNGKSWTISWKTWREVLYHEQKLIDAGWTAGEKSA